MNKQLFEDVDLLFIKITDSDDEGAFRRLFYKMFSPLCVFAHRYIEDMETCEDIVQDIFFMVWENRKDLHLKTSAKSFLLVSVRNACLDLLRKQEVEQKWVSYAMTEEHDVNDVDLYTTKELESVLNASLEKLPQKVSMIFKLNRFDGKTYAEIAQEKNISVKTVEANMTKALKFLRVALRDYLPFLFIRLVLVH